MSLEQGSIAYVAQQAWIQNLTVRDNILFGEPLDSCKYNDVVRACELLEDFDMLPAGGLTEIGERVSLIIFLNLTWWWWWWVYPTHSWGWGRGSIPRNPNNRATPHGRDQRSRREGVWPKMSRRRGSSTGQSSTRCERSCGSEPQLLHEGVSARPILWR